MFQIIIFFFTVVLALIVFKAFWKVLTGKSQRKTKEKRLKNTQLIEAHDDKGIDDAVRNTVSDFGGEIAEGASEIGETLGAATLDIRDTLRSGGDSQDSTRNIGKVAAVASYEITKTIGFTAVNAGSVAGKRLLSFMKKASN